MKVAYSFVLYERGADRNYLRVHADSVDQPFDINSGAKLILGSTAKLRTMITYLNIIAELHRRFVGLPASALRSIADSSTNPLTRWAAGYLTGAKDWSLRLMLGAAMDRRYSASPYETFFTGSGAHVFRNFEKEEDSENPTVEEAFERSINLSFVRLLRDIVRYYMAQNADVQRVLSQRSEPSREMYLRRFADQDGRRYLDRFYAKYRSLSSDDALSLVAGRTTPTATHLVIVFRSIRPAASSGDLREFLAGRLGRDHPDDGVIEKLYAKYAPGRFFLADRAYVTGIHPLELWLVAYLQEHPGASYLDTIRASARARQDVYRWLFKTPYVLRQNVRIRILLEQDAFERILQDWQRLGYPFGQLVPSLATAIGSSGDRPDALADLMGIILNGGLKLQNADIETLRFASGTPYETEMAFEPRTPERVLAPEVAECLRRALRGVVANGTGRRLRGLYETANGQTADLGGKTGTGDNRFDRFDQWRRLIASRSVDRTATFVFFIDDRFFGAITAYVSGAEAGRAHFTSALAVELLRALSPALRDITRLGTISTVGGLKDKYRHSPRIGSDN
jgi:membrane peptidoglycan carboxypeptidase